ncbi:hypothetical protein GCM10027605_73160 [Micromonospora zhanjiangensis]
MSRIKEFPLPDLGEGLTEGEILKWMVSAGDMIELNQPIVEVETAKAAVEIPAKWGGRVHAIFHEEGTVVEVGSPIIAIDTDPGAGPVPSAPAGGAVPAGAAGPGATTSQSTDALPEPSAESLAAVQLAPAEGAVEPGLIGGPAPGGRTAVLVGYGPKTTVAKRRPRKTDAAGPAGTTAPAPAVATPAPVEPAPAPRPATATPAPAPAPVPRTGAVVLAKPPVRKLARDLGVDLAGVVGSGPLGSITRDDVHAAAAGRTATAEPVVAPAPAASGFGADREQRIPVKGCASSPPRTWPGRRSPRRTSPSS